MCVLLPPFLDAGHPEACGKPGYPTHETYVSAEQNKACTHTRLSCPHGHQGRAPRVEAPPCQGSRQAHAVTPSRRQSPFPWLAAPSTGFRKRTGCLTPPRFRVCSKKRRVAGINGLRYFAGKTRKTSQGSVLRSQKSTAVVRRAGTGSSALSGSRSGNTRQSWPGWTWS